MVTVPLPCGDTELCPVHALELWLQAAGSAEGPVFRRIWLPPRLKATKAAEPPALAATPATARIDTQAISPQTVARVVQARAMAAGSAGATLAAIASNVALSLRAWIAVPIPPT